MQAPPEQVACGVWAPSTQVSGAQGVPSVYVRQSPLPSHFESVPHEVGPMSLQVPVGSSPPAGTGLHCPGAVGSAQVMHFPWQADSQHTWSTQWVLWHSDPSVQLAPIAPGPHLPVVRSHFFGETQSLSDLHITMQSLLPHRAGAQSFCAGISRAPSPLQVPGVVAIVPEHVPAVQTVPWS